MTVDEIRREERRKAYAEVIAAIEDIRRLYQTGIPRLPAHPLNLRAAIVIAEFGDLIEALKERALEPA